eukprot:385547_1
MGQQHSADSNDSFNNIDQKYDMSSVPNKPCSVADCYHTTQFVKTMNTYQSWTNDVNINNMSDITQMIRGNVDISKALNDYFHLIHEHVDDDDFLFIVSSLGHCDIHTCSKFRRNYRNRTQLSHKKNFDNELLVKDKVHIQLMDKMHCYFYHCLDIGHRAINECKSSRDSSPKQSNIHSLATHSKYCKFNQLHLTYHDIKHGMYSYGYSFRYKAPAFHRRKDGQIDPDFAFHERQSHIYVQQKYQSLKEELTQNIVACLSLEQYKSEYMKAYIHYNSFYRKKLYPSTESLTIEKSHLLSLMIYCNYTRFQYELSKTYRESNGEKHGYFYWNGLYLNESIVHFGTKVFDGDVRQFYHGITQSLIFPYENNGVWISCPLSTSSSFEVAVNFANTDDGIIVEFGQDKKLTMTNYKHLGIKQYFSVSWLSDFANESEYLFKSGVLCVNNITNLQGVEYINVIEAFRLMDNMLFYVPINEKKQSSIDISDEMRSLIFKIISNTVTNNDFNDAYISSMCKQYFQSKNIIRLETGKHWSKLKYICGILLSNELHIDLDKITDLFPNVEELHMGEIIWNPSIYDEILRLNCKEGHLQCISLKPRDNIKENSIIPFHLIATNSIVRKLRSEEIFIFEKYHPVTREHTCVQILKCNPEEAVQMILGHDGCFDGHSHNDVDNVIKTLANHKILQEFAGIGDLSQQTFHQFCIGMEYLTVYPDSLSVQLLHHPNSEWIKINDVIRLFPNLTTMDCRNFKLSPLMFEDILSSDVDFTVNLLHVIADDTFSTSWAMGKYKIKLQNKGIDMVEGNYYENHFGRKGLYSELYLRWNKIPSTKTFADLICCI